MPWTSTTSAGSEPETQALDALFGRVGFEHYINFALLGDDKVLYRAPRKTDRALSEDLASDVSYALQQTVQSYVTFLRGEVDSLLQAISTADRIRFAVAYVVLSPSSSSLFSMGDAADEC